MRTSAIAPEWLALLECANPHPAAQRLTELVRNPVDWSALLALADEHGILPLLAKRLQDVEDAIVPPEIRQKLRGRQRAQVVFTLSMTAGLFRLLDRFAASGIDTLLTKGPVLSMRCYGDPGLRQYCDLDLIVRGRDIQRSTEEMIALGYEPKVPLAAIQAQKLPGEYVFARRDTKLLVEFHTEHTFRYHPRPLPLERLFKRQIRVQVDGHDVPSLSTEDELLLICIHGTKHFWERLMWIADVAALVSRQTIDWGRAISAAREVGAERMLRVGLLLATDVLDVRLPAEVAADVHSDTPAARVAARIAKRLPSANSAPLGLFERAAFRMKTRGGFLAGAAYLLRLSLSPTEEDWVSGSEEKRPWLLDAIGRPFRLARKYGRDGRQ
jgi:putative nucleotidyltransferase-like protein